MVPETQRVNLHRDFQLQSVLGQPSHSKAEVEGNSIALFCTAIGRGASTLDDERWWIGTLTRTKNSLFCTKLSLRRGRG